MQQRILLEMEHAAEREAFKKLTETMGLQRKVKRGDAWFPITTGKACYNSLNQYVIEVFRNADEDTYHNFEYGKPLMFFSINGKTNSSLTNLLNIVTSILLFGLNSSLMNNHASFNVSALKKIHVILIKTKLINHFIKFGTLFAYGLINLLIHIAIPCISPHIIKV